MKKQPWIRIHDGLFIDPMVVEAVELKDAETQQTDRFFIRVHSANSFYDSMYMEQKAAVEFMDLVMEQLVPD